MIRTYEEIDQVMRRIEAIVHKYIPNAGVMIAPFVDYYATTHIPPRRSSGRRVIIQFSRNLIERGTWEQIEDTVAHEIAHVLAADRDDKSAAEHDWHTGEWGDIAQALGSDITMPPFPNVEELQRYKYRCADCGYMTTVSEERYKALTILHHGRMSAPSSDVAEHVAATGHHEWYVLDEMTGRRWTKTH
jgi:hypothetical protein